ncbi:MAG: type 2 isopentenyl-diphosphate Delta-isomerase [Methanobacteriaceae archaeon]
MISDRKLAHILLCKHYDVQYKNKTTGFEDIELIHRALGGLDKNEIDLSTTAFGKKLESPLIITAITGGHPASLKINKELAIAAEKCQIGMGIGSQRAAIENPKLNDTYTIARDMAPSTLLIGNIGAPQIEYASKAVEMLDADILAVHLNPLQESIQPEGDVSSKGLVDSIKEIVNTVDVPVMAKETGTGIATEDAVTLESCGISSIDVSGAGGTSWAAVETYRAEDKHMGELFWDWGIPTAVSTVEVANSVNIPIISSGGIRSAIDAAKAIALGADAVGMALPMLQNIGTGKNGHNNLINFINQFNESLKIAMFLVGASNIEELKNSNLIIKGDTKDWLKSRGFNTEKYSRRI